MILSTPTLILPPLKGEESFLETWMPRSKLRGSSLINIRLLSINSKKSDLQIVSLNW